MANQNFNEYDFVSFWMSSHLSDEEHEKALLKNPLVPCVLEYKEEEIRSYGAMESTIEELLIHLIEAEGIKCEHTWAKEGIRRREILEEWSQNWGALDKGLRFKFVNHKYMHSLVATHPELFSWALKQTPKLIEIHDLCWPRYDYGDTNWEEFGDETTNEEISQAAKNYEIEPNFDEMSSEEFLYLDSDPSDLF
jgi:hypothetical protein